MKIERYSTNSYWNILQCEHKEIGIGVTSGLGVGGRGQVDGALKKGAFIDNFASPPPWKFPLLKK